MSSVGILVCHALELRTAVGQPHSRWTSTARGSLTDVPDSNRCTQLQRLCATDPARTHSEARPRPTPNTRAGLKDSRWTTAQPLDIHGPQISHRCTQLQPMYPTPTPVRHRPPPAPASDVGPGSPAPTAMPDHGPHPTHALDSSTAVGQPHSRWTSTARGSLTDVPNSNRCTQLQRLCATDPTQQQPWQG